MRLKLIQAGELVLRERTRPLRAAELRSSAMHRLIDDMQETLRDAPGVGLAAPQVGMPLQLAIIEDLPEYSAAMTPAQRAERERKPVPFHVLANPKIVEYSGPELTFFEGCLSVNGYTALVPRSRSVRVQYLDATGKACEVRASGWYARILQHEIDHLNGTLYVDRLDDRQAKKARKAVKRNGWGKPGNAWHPGVDRDPFGHDEHDEQDEHEHAAHDAATGDRHADELIG